MNKPGRPKRKYELKLEGLIERLASLGLKNTTIGEILGVDDSTLARNFEKNLIKGRENLKNNISAKQIELALRGNKGEGNAVMLIWLGKQYLGQSDKSEGKEEIRLILKKIDATTID